ncbi:MAG: hypothetical protein KJO98_13325 [Rhodothermia bacterium]|nr:hypothetical protein [Rhodothermia bacterium]
MRYRFFAVLGAVVLMTLTSIGCDSESEESIVDNTNFTATGDFHHTVQAANRTTLRVEGINGEVKVRAVANAGSVVIAGERRVKSDSFSDASDFLRQVTVVVTESGDEIVARTEQPNNPGGRECVVDYEITVPKDLLVDVRHINGAVSLQEFESSAYVDLINGTLAAEIDLPPSGTIDMTVINGTLLLEIPATTSASVAAGVTNGELFVSNLDFVNRQSSERSLTATLGSADGNIRLSVINGTLMLRGVGS